MTNTATIVNLNHIKDLRIAKEMGYREYWAYTPKTDNPYRIASLRNAWNDGWEEAEGEFLEFEKDLPLTERYTNNIVQFKR